MGSNVIFKYDWPIKPQNLCSWLVKSSQSNFYLQLPDCYSVRIYLITTVKHISQLAGYYASNIELGHQKSFGFNVLTRRGSSHGDFFMSSRQNAVYIAFTVKVRNGFGHGLRTPRDEIVFTARPKINSHSQIYSYGQSIFCLPDQPNFSHIFDLCLHWVSVVRGQSHHPSQKWILENH